MTIESRFRGTVVLVMALTAIAPLPASGQIRPLDPLPWDAFAAPGVSLGVGAYMDQRASLAGTKGTLIEVGSLEAWWPLGRVVIHLSGTALRVFEDDSAYAAPSGGTRPSDGRHRVDTGDHAVSTVVLLTRPGSALASALRFGVRLPTSDDVDGLGRDRTDFFASLGGRWSGEGVAVMAEAGIGVLGTRDAELDQVDPLLGAVGASWDAGPVRLTGWVLGQHDTRRGPALRGTEDLGEIRLSAEIGEARLIRAVIVRGFTDFSPSLGLRLESDVRF